MKYAIIYHDADFDGKLSNEVCRHWLATKHPGSVIHSYGWDYGRPEPVTSQLAFDDGSMEGVCAGWEHYDRIFIVDLSVDTLMARTDLRDKIVWIDHHKSALEKWDHVVEEGHYHPDNPVSVKPFAGYRIDGVAACRLCWQFFLHWVPDINEFGAVNPYSVLPGKVGFVARCVPEPRLIRLVGEYDVWDHRDPDTKPLQFGLRACSGQELGRLVFEQFSDTPEGDALLLDVVAGGRMVQLYCDAQNLDYASKFAHTIQWEGLTFCALNIAQRGNSDLFHGAVGPRHDALFAWRFDGPSGSCIVSLYHAPGKTHLDLSEIAKKYGGGGHRGACGFRASLTELAVILQPR